MSRSFIKKPLTYLILIADGLLTYAMSANIQNFLAFLLGVALMLVIRLALEG